MDIFGYTVEMLSQLKMETFCCFEKYICKNTFFCFCVQFCTIGAIRLALLKDTWGWNHWVSYIVMYMLARQRVMWWSL